MTKLERQAGETTCFNLNTHIPQWVFEQDGVHTDWERFKKLFLTEFTEETDYFTPLRNEVINDDRVIRAFFEFLRARKIKPTYHGKDIPVGAYQRALKDANRPESERFLEWLVGEETVDVKTLHLPSYATAERYKAFKGEEAQDRSTDSILKQLKLKEIPGVCTSEIARPQNLKWCTGEDREPGVVHFGARCALWATGIPPRAQTLMRRTTRDWPSRTA